MVHFIHRVLKLFINSLKSQLAEIWNENSLLTELQRICGYVFQSTTIDQITIYSVNRYVLFKDCLRIKNETNKIQ